MVDKKPVSKTQTSEFLLPDHLVKEIISSWEEVSDLAALFISLGSVEDLQFTGLSEVITDGRNLEHDPLQWSVVSYNL